MGLISFGNINKKYFEIILAYLVSNFVYKLLLMSLLIFFFKEKIYIIYLILSNYFGEFLCFIPGLIFKKKNKSSNSKEISNNKDYNNHLMQCIFNNPLDQSLTIKEIGTLFAICLLSLLYNILIFIIKIINKKNNEQNIINNEYFFISPFFSLIISIFAFNKKFYKHQYYSIIIAALIEIIKFVIDIIIKNNDIDIKTIFIILLLLIINSILWSLVYEYKKLLMNVKYFSVFKCCYTFGIINLPIIIVLYIIISNFECSGPSIFCEIEYNDKYIYR